MLSQVARFLRGAESVTLNLSRDKAGMVRLLIQPVLGSEPDDLSEQLQQLRAALALPVLVATPEDQLDEVWPKLLARSVAARDGVAEIYEESVSQLEAAAANAKKLADEKAQQAAEKKASTPPAKPGKPGPKASKKEPRKAAEKTTEAPPALGASSISGSPQPQQEPDPGHVLPAGPGSPNFCVSTSVTRSLFEEDEV